MARHLSAVGYLFAHLITLIEIKKLQRIFIVILNSFIFHDLFFFRIFLFVSSPLPVWINVSTAFDRNNKYQLCKFFCPAYHFITGYLTSSRLSTPVTNEKWSARCCQGVTRGGCEWPSNNYEDSSARLLIFIKSSNSETLASRLADTGWGGGSSV